MRSPIELFPLDVVVVGEHGHAGSVRDMLVWYLQTAKAVRNFGLIFHLENGLKLALAGKVNTIIVSPHHISTTEDLKKNAEFMLRLREQRPEIVFVLNVNNEFYKELCNYNERFKHYFRVDRRSVSAAYDEDKEKVRRLHATLDDLLFRCQKWHYGLFKYDVAISFAGTERKIARSLARHLERLGSRVFFDEFEKAAIVGKELYSYLRDVYSEEARYCCLLISQAYAEGMWTSHERQAAQERALKMRGREYIIPIRIDDTPLPGLMDTIAYISISTGVANVARVINEKLWLIPARRKNYPAFFDRQTIG